MNIQNLVNNLTVSALLLVSLSSHAQVEIQRTINSVEQPAAGAQDVPPARERPEPGFAPTNAIPLQIESRPLSYMPSQRYDAGIAGKAVPVRTVNTKPAPAAARADQFNKNVKLDSIDDDLPVSSGIERVMYRRMPIQVVLRQGKERALHFQNPITIYVPDSVADLITLDVMDHTTYITANEEFPQVRAIVHDLTTDQKIPLDLRSSREAAVSSELEIFTSSTDRDRQAARRAAPDNGDDPEIEPQVDMVTLTRYAARMLYAPRRLMPKVAGVRQVRVSTRPVNGLYPGANVETAPIGAWRSSELFVTAVKFVNRGKTPVELDLEELRGNWIAATSQHGRLGTAGSEEDTTAVYLISDRPFEESR